MFANSLPLYGSNVNYDLGLNLVEHASHTEGLNSRIIEVFSRVDNEYIKK